MNLKLIMLALFLCLESTPAQETEKLSKEYISKLDFIGIAVVQEKSAWHPDRLTVVVSRVFKGYSELGNTIDLDSSTYDFKEGEEYLLYATQQHGEKLIVYKDSRTRLLEHAQDDIQFLQQNIECIDASLIKSDGACHRYYKLICGCDGKTYSNACEARKNIGLAAYTIGKCKEN